ncbi:MAG TPA: topoisomerase C-terminal repeat-containing protein, partial [Cyclobacteriaceae bacterium]|nr:topoisomerase C-terminal repeat-containing protein [Cyclobacteriaceae bacterium]
NITNYSFTAEIEQEFDEIAAGNLKWKKMIDQFYRPFHKVVTATEKVERSSVQNKSKELGVDPKTGKNIYVKLGKFGAYVQLGENPDDNGGEKPKYASLRPGQFIENITIDHALELFKMPRDMGLFEDKSVSVSIGRFGPYVLHDKKYVSIPKEEDPYTITPARAVELIQNKRVADANKLIKSFAENPDIQVLNGRFGPYIKAGTKNVKIPKGKAPEELTLEECVTLAANTPEKKGRFGFRKKAEPAPAPAKKEVTVKKKAVKVAAKPAVKVAAKSPAKVAAKASVKAVAKKSVKAAAKKSVKKVAKKAKTVKKR